MEFAVMTDEKKELSTKKIRSHYLKCLDEISRPFLTTKHIDVESVHELRVNLKRVDALLALLKYTRSKIPKEKSKPFKKLFRLAGKLRAIQVEFEVIEKYFSDDSFNTNYLHQLHEIKVKRLAAYSKYLGSGISRSLKDGIRLLRKKASQLTKKQIIRYLGAEEKKVGKRLKRSVFREQALHLMRKDLKRYYLNSKMAEYSNERIETMLELLGDWHDLQIAFDHVVKTIYTGHLTGPESEPIKKIKHDLIADKESAYEKIVAYYSDNMRDERDLK